MPPADRNPLDSRGRSAPVSRCRSGPSAARRREQPRDGSLGVTEVEIGDPFEAVRRLGKRRDQPGQARSPRRDRRPEGAGHSSGGPIPSRRGSSRPARQSSRSSHPSSLRAGRGSNHRRRPGTSGGRAPGSGRRARPPRARRVGPPHRAPAPARRGDARSDRAHTRQAVRPLFAQRVGPVQVADDVRRPTAADDHQGPLGDFGRRGTPPVARAGRASRAGSPRP